MIDIQFKADELKLTMKGHAQHGEAGHDLVCSAASMLFYTLAQSVTDSVDMMKKPTRIKNKSGDAEIHCTPKPKYRQIISHIYWVVLEGYQLLARDYPDNVKFTVI